MFDFSPQLDQPIIDIDAALLPNTPTFGVLSTGDVIVSMDYYANNHSTDIVVPITLKGRRAELAFVGLRADLYFQTVLAAMAAIEAVGGVPSMTLTVTGTWTKRPWTKRNGEQTHTWQLLVAAWSWVDHTGTRTAGHVPPGLPKA